MTTPAPYDPNREDGRLADEVNLHAGRGPRVIIEWSDARKLMATVLLKADQQGNLYAWGSANVPEGFLMIWPRHTGHQLVRMADVARLYFTDDPKEPSDAPA